MIEFFRFIKSIWSFWKYFKDWGYDGKATEFIVETYLDVICNRTVGMSKPTYSLEAVLQQMDEWYENLYSEEREFEIEPQDLEDDCK